MHPIAQWTSRMYTFCITETWCSPIAASPAPPPQPPGPGTPCSILCFHESDSCGYFIQVEFCSICGSGPGLLHLAVFSKSMPRILLRIPGFPSLRGRTTFLCTSTPHFLHPFIWRRRLHCFHTSALVHDAAVNIELKSSCAAKERLTE